MLIDLHGENSRLLTVNRIVDNLWITIVFWGKMWCRYLYITLI